MLAIFPQADRFADGRCSSFDYESIGCVIYMMSHLKKIVKDLGLIDPQSGYSWWSLAPRVLI